MNRTSDTAWQRGLTVAGLMMLLLSACAANSTSGRAMTVMGFGQVTGQPDMAVVTFGIWSKDEDANKAILNSKSKLAELMAAMTALGVDEKDIQPLAPSMTSEQIMGPDGFPTNRLLYGMNHTVTVTLHQTERAGDVLNTLREIVGAPYLFSLAVNYDLSEDLRREVLAEAQAKALEEANANAARLAQSLGLTVDVPLEVRVTNQQVTPNPMLQAQVTMQVRYRLK
jgi:uncharacterized protein